jgi:hypothetical protein
LLLGLAAFGAMRLGGRSDEARLLPGGDIKGTPLEASQAISYDPFTTDAVKVENPDSVGNAIDGNETTAWTTEGYSGTADFNGDKAGVGLIVAMPEEREVGKTRVLWVTQGCSFELRYSDDPGASIGGWTTAARIENSKLAAAFEFEAASARYWMVWITQLVPDGNKFRCGIREVELFSP